MRGTGSSGYYRVLRLLNAVQSLVMLGLKIPIATGQDQEQLTSFRGPNLPLALKKKKEKRKCLNFQNLLHLRKLHFPSAPRTKLNKSGRGKKKSPATSVCK